MGVDKTLEKVLRGRSDTNIRFDELVELLIDRGFRVRVSGSHHIFVKPVFASASTSSAKARKRSRIRFDKCGGFSQITD